MHADNGWPGSGEFALTEWALLLSLSSTTTHPL